MEPAAIAVTAMKQLGIFECVVVRASSVHQSPASSNYSSRTYIVKYHRRVSEDAHTILRSAQRFRTQRAARHERRKANCLSTIESIKSLDHRVGRDTIKDMGHTKLQKDMRRRPPARNSYREPVYGISMSFYCGFLYRVILLFFVFFSYCTRSSNVHRDNILASCATASMCI